MKNFVLNLVTFGAYGRQTRRLATAEEIITYLRGARRHHMDNYIRVLREKSDEQIKARAEIAELKRKNAFLSDVKDVIDTNYNLVREDRNEALRSAKVLNEELVATRNELDKLRTRKRRAA